MLVSKRDQAWLRLSDLRGAEAKVGRAVGESNS